MAAAAQKRESSIPNMSKYLAAEQKMRQSSEPKMSPRRSGETSTAGLMGAMENRASEGAAAARESSRERPSSSALHSATIDMNKYSQKAYDQKVLDNEHAKWERKQADEARRQAAMIANIHARREERHLPRVSDEDALAWSRAQGAAADRKRRMASAASKIPASAPLAIDAEEAAKWAVRRVTRSAAKRVRFNEGTSADGQAEPETEAADQPPPLKTGISDIFSQSSLG